MGQNPSRQKLSFYCMRKIAGKRQKAKQYVDSPDDVYGFEYKLKNAFSLLERAEKITPGDKQKILQFVGILKALRVSKGFCPMGYGASGGI